MSNRLGFVELSEKVIAPGICTGCGACVVVCPLEGVLDYAYGTPRLVGECTRCGICPRVCPRYDLQLEELEGLIFGRARKDDEPFGVFNNLHVAMSVEEAILKVGQDGGVATALLTTALDSGAIDGAVVSGLDPSVPWLPKPLVVITREEVIENAGTRYTYSPGLLALKTGVSQGLKRLAFVGLPCQILAIRRMEKAKLRKYTDAIAFAVGLFCSESFSYNGLMLSNIQKELSIDLGQVEKMSIKGKMLVTLKGGRVVEIPLKELREYAEPKCGFCADFSAELADISLGGVGLDGWTFVVVRTERGEAVFRRAAEQGALEVRPESEFKRARRLLVRLSEAKRKKVQKAA